jgi:DNA-binding response OmpR family regulator
VPTRSSLPDPENCGGEEAAFQLVPERFGVQVGAVEAVVTATQFRLLTVLMSAPGQIFTRAELIERVFGRAVDGRTVDVHIKELRRKLEPHGRRIETARGRGYRYRPAGKQEPGN